MEILWNEWKEENIYKIADTDMFKEFVSHINTKFNYNAYAMDFLTRDQAYKASTFPNDFTINKVPTHEEIFKKLGMVINDGQSMNVDSKKDEVDEDGEERIIT